VAGVTRVRPNFDATTTKHRTAQHCTTPRLHNLSALPVLHCYHQFHQAQFAEENNRQTTNMEQNRQLTFLDLPDRARRSIYALSGLARQCPIDLASKRPMIRKRLQCWYKLRLSGVISSIEPGSRPCECERFPLELTLVSRQVREESLDVLLGANVYIARALHGRSDMLPRLLDGIPPAQLARMTRWVVRLNHWPCRWGHDMAVRLPRGLVQCEICSSSEGDGDPALSSSSLASLGIIEAWEDFCRLLGRGRQPGQTELTLICDVDDTSAGARIVDPLMKSLPQLRSCNIRLGRSSADWNLANMARDTSLFMTRSQPLQSAKPFPFGRLPRELKLNILKYTHLGPRELAGYSDEFATVRVDNGRLVRSNDQLLTSRRSLDDCCGECTDAAFDWLVYDTSSCVSVVTTRPNRIPRTAAASTLTPPSPLVAPVGPFPLLSSS